MGKVKEWIGELNETYYNIGYILVTILAGVLAIAFGLATAEVIFGILIKSAIYVISSALFMKALMGPRVDIKKEILTENNIALAILVGSFLVGLGCALSGF